MSTEQLQINSASPKGQQQIHPEFEISPQSRKTSFIHKMIPKRKKFLYIIGALIIAALLVILLTSRDVKIWAFEALRDLALYLRYLAKKKHFSVLHGQYSCDDNCNVDIFASYTVSPYLDILSLEYLGCAAHNISLYSISGYPWVVYCQGVLWDMFQEKSTR